MLPLLLLTALTILPAWELSAGKPLKTDEKDIRTTVRAWLEGFLGEEETRQVIAQYPGVKGEQTWDLVVHAKARAG